ncbi:MAG: hypothetical protein FJ202_11120 [Gemmatimonadetes bacterium]|nr:hypothetical protein [Gemmatimonadota bacterium]
MSDPTAVPSRTATVESLAALYLGNILYALERCAMSLEAEGKADEAAFYRGIGRLLADARGREKA